MAEYIKFRLSAAKAGVTMAFLALLGGLAERASAGGKHPARTTAARNLKWTPVLSLKGINGNLRSSLLTLKTDLASVYAKDQKALSADVAKIYQKDKLDFYGKAAANSTFLKQEDAGKVYLKSTDAGKEYLKLDGTAANSNLLGNLPASAFVHGAGGVATGGATLSITDGTRELLQSTDGALTVSAINGGNGPSVVVQNNSASPIDWVASPALFGMQGNHGTISGNGKATIQLGAPGTIVQETFQFMPAVQTQAYTLIVTTEGAVGSPSARIVAQMLNGGG
jgi:hypothetical protein